MCNVDYLFFFLIVFLLTGYCSPMVPYQLHSWRPHWPNVLHEVVFYSSYHVRLERPADLIHDTKSVKYVQWNRMTDIVFTTNGLMFF